MTTSSVPTVPAFKRAWLALIRARQNIVDQQVQVELRWPGGDTQPTGIYLSGLDPDAPEVRGVFEPSAMGAAPMRMDEVSEVDVTIQSFDSAPDVNVEDSDSEERVFELLGEALNALRVDPKANDSIQFPVEVRYEVRTFPHPDGSGWASQLSATFVFRSRIQS